MKTYIGTKIINARPMTRLEYNEYRGWPLPQDESGEDWGYLVEYMDGGKPNHADHKGYISWSPKEQFDKAYAELNGEAKMSFGNAITLLKAGQKVARGGWNGKGMWLILVPGTKGAVTKAGTPYGDALGEGAGLEILPHIDMYTVNSEGRRAMLPGWVASQTDMLSNDWVVVPRNA